MTDKLLAEFRMDVKGLKLIPSRGGCFEIWVNEEQIYSKLDTGEFPVDTEIIVAVRKRLAMQ